MGPRDRTPGARRHPRWFKLNPYVECRHVAVEGVQGALDRRDLPERGVQLASSAALP
jgi:hypothetical protein